MLIDNVMRHAILLFSLTAFLCAAFSEAGMPSPWIWSGRKGKIRDNR